VIKSLLRSIAASVPVSRIEQFYGHALHGDKFEPSLAGSALFHRREQVWSDLAERVGPDAKILYLEFGVYAGNSITAWAGLNRNPDSRFIGFDTFEGLPEAWAGLEEGHFSTHGSLPQVDDPRIEFVKGYFQHTVRDTLKGINVSLFDEIVVHFDADLFSSTVFSLVQVLQITPKFYAMFDEFSGDEARAFYALERAFMLKANWFARTEAEDRPVHVSCQISSEATVL
jgi:hypothetical protein